MPVWIAGNTRPRLNRTYSPVWFSEISQQDPEYALVLEWTYGKTRGTGQSFGTVVLPGRERDELTISAFNESIRNDVQKARNVDKGFAHYVSRHKRDHRCILVGVLGNRPEEEVQEDAMWIACAEWSNFEPIPGHPKEHPELLHFPTECSHFSEGKVLTDLSESPIYLDASPYRKVLIEEFCMGCRKFAGQVSLAPVCDATLSRYPG
jgi:hypothetical protein